MAVRSVVLALGLMAAACATSPPALPSVGPGGLRVVLTPYVAADAGQLPLRICVLDGGGAPDRGYRLYTVTTSGAPAVSDTTNTSLFYRFVVGADTMRRAWCTLPGSVPVAAAVLRQLQRGDATFPVVLGPQWTRGRLPPTQPGVLECDTDHTYRSCYATEAVAIPGNGPEVWRFDRVPFVAADSTDYGLPGSSWHAANPDCLPCLVPASAFTPVDALNQRVSADPFFLIRRFGGRQ